MATVEETFTWETLHEQDGLKVSKSPWGADDEIGRFAVELLAKNRRIPIEVA